jgi:predicted heme/steroid binding protein
MKGLPIFWFKSSWILAMRRLTREELSQYNGRDGCPAYIAYDSKVYDVSKSFLWKKGRHQVLHTAGVDLTTELAAAPHGEDMLERFPVVGMLIDTR